VEVPAFPFLWAECLVRAREASRCTGIRAAECAAGGPHINQVGYISMYMLLENGLVLRIDALLYTNRAATHLLLALPMAPQSPWASLVSSTLLHATDMPQERVGEVFAEFRKLYRQACIENGIAPCDAMPEARDYVVHSTLNPSSTSRSKSGEL